MHSDNLLEELKSAILVASIRDLQAKDPHTQVAIEQASYDKRNFDVSCLDLFNQYIISFQCLQIPSYSRATALLYQKSYVDLSSVCAMPIHPLDILPLIEHELIFVHIISCQMPNRMWSNGSKAVRLGHQYSLILLDHFINWPEVVPLTEISAPTIVSVIYEQWIFRYGYTVMGPKCSRHCHAWSYQNHRDR